MKTGKNDRNLIIDRPIKQPNSPNYSEDKIWHCDPPVLRILDDRDDEEAAKLVNVDCYSLDSFDAEINNFLTQLKESGRFYERSHIHLTSSHPLIDSYDVSDNVCLYVVDPSIKLKNAELKNNYLKERAAWNEYREHQRLSDQKSKHEEALAKLRLQKLQIERELSEMEQRSISKS